MCVSVSPSYHLQPEGERVHTSVNIPVDCDGQLCYNWMNGAWSVCLFWNFIIIIIVTSLCSFSWFPYTMYPYIFRARNFIINSGESLKLQMGTFCCCFCGCMQNQSYSIPIKVSCVQLWLHLLFCVVLWEKLVSGSDTTSLKNTSTDSACLQ